MASTNKTANLSLNQWVPTDPVLMEDMNEDNRKLDAALGAVMRTKLFDITLSTAKNLFMLDFSTIDLSKYQELEFYISIVGGENGKCVCTNGITSGYIRYFGSGHCSESHMQTGDGKNVMELYGSYIQWNAPNHVQCGSISWSQLNNKLESLYFTKATADIADYGIGTKVLVLGVKSW
ncbi:MAG: hypothetical protein RSE97_08840 [Oscillospiraceae bacterium]